MKNKKTAALLCAFMVLSLVLFPGCSAIGKLFNKTPDNYTEGIKYSKDYEEDVLEIYDGAVVFDELAVFGENVLFCGSEDDFDDIVDFYKEFFQDNEITLLEEDEGRDEYYARGVFEGYEFKLKIAEPEDEYAGELFQNVITLLTRELKEVERVDMAETPTPAPAAEPTPTPVPGQTTQATASIERPPNDAYETRLVSLAPGTWALNQYVSTDTSGLDWTFYINDGSTGTMYYSDFQYGERWWADFTYTIQDGVLNIIFPDNETWSFFAYFDYESLHLVPIEDFSIDHYLYNYGEAEPSSSFTALGDWMLFHPDDGFIGTLAFWPNGTGYVYNWYSNESDVYFTWEDNDGTVTFRDEMGSEIDTFTFVHRYNVLEYYSLYHPDKPLFYNRTELNLLPGSYTLNQSSDPGLYGWELELYPDYSASVKIQNSEGNLEDSEASWYLDYYEGKLWIYMSEYYYSFDYHHFVGGLLFWDAVNEYYYEFTMVE